MTILIVAIMLLLLVSLAITAWHQLFPRPATPTYVCVYVTDHGAVSSSGQWPCPPPTGGAAPITRSTRPSR